MTACGAGKTDSGAGTDSTEKTESIAEIASSAETEPVGEDSIAAETEPADEGSRHVVILATSDIHSNVWGYAYEDDADTKNNGMARLYTYIQQMREEYPDLILVDAGDDIQGTIMSDDIYNKTPMSLTRSWLP